MHAIRGTDFEHGLAALFDDFVNSRRAITLGGLVVNRQIVLDGNRDIFQFEV